MGSPIEVLKEQALAQKPVLLFTFTFVDGSVRRLASHAVTYGGNTYEARIVRHNLFDMQLLSESGIDQIPQLSLTLANADTQMSQLNATKGFKGATLAVVFAIAAAAGGAGSSDTWTLFTGLCNAPSEITDIELTVSAQNRLSLSRVVLPPVRIQKRCPWAFPSTAADRDAGAKKRNSIFYMCGYAPDIPAGGDDPGADGKHPRGNTDGGGQPFTTCNYTRADCVARGMFQADSLARATARFGGIEYAPPIIRVRPYGSRESIDSPVIQAKFGDPIPLVYGQAWMRPPVTALRGDGNLTRFEAVVSFGEISDILQVVVNGFVVPRGITGRDMTGSGWYNLVNSGTREGGFDLQFGPAGTSDPYGSMAYLAVSLPTKAADGSAAPDIQVLARGRLVETFDAGGNSLGWSWSQNPVWILLDVLKLGRWKIADLDLASFHSAAQYCDAAISQTDDFGNTTSLPRFRANFAIENRISAAEAVLGLRNNARIYFTYSSAGKLQCQIEQTIAGQQPTKPYGSNAAATVNGGWPAYVYSDVTPTILRRQETPGSVSTRDGGASSLRAFCRPIADTPTRVGFEFQNEFNQHSQDSIAVVDVDEQRDVGQDVSALMPVLGVPNYHQALRVANLLLAKSVKGNLFIEFDSSIKAVGQQVGHIIAVSYTKENWTNKLFRILKIAPKENMREVTITAQAHEDTWYTDAAAPPPRRRACMPYLPDRPPNPVKGTFFGLNTLSTEPDDARDPYIRVTSEDAVVGRDGTPVIRINLILAGPPASMSHKTTAPQLDLQATVETTGGSLPGGITLYYAVAAVDADLARSCLSWIVTVNIPAGTNTNKVTLTGIKLDADAASMVIYRGKSPHTLIGQEKSVAATFVDDGTPAALNPTESPFDPFLDHVNYYWRRVLNTRSLDANLFIATADQFSSSTIGYTGLAMTPGAHAGYVVEIVRGWGAGQRRTVSSNTATVLTISGSWQITPNGTSVFVVHNRATSATGNTITDSGANFPDLTGARVRITHGKGRYQEYTIAANTPTVITIGGAWEETPDTTSAFVIAENGWTLGVSTGAVEISTLAQELRGAVTVPNEMNLLIEYTARAADAADSEAVYNLGHVARYAIAGSEQTPIFLDGTTRKRMRVVNNDVVFDNV